ncbi:MAG: ATP-dependent RNA helicase HrpA [Thiobacillaceae bacterium]
MDFPEELPVSARREEIAALLARHQVIIVCGETGSGKTTQLPKIAWMAGRGRAGLIGMTQPRRIAARSVAGRLAEETRTPLGGFVGWQVRFTDRVSADSRIKVMTDGILLAETQSDPILRAYDTLILDEVHERSLNIDFLLGYLKQLLQRRPDLKLVLSSATLEAERFAAWFGGAPVVQVSGRTYAVEIRYRPIADKPNQEGQAKARTAETEMVTAILDAVDELAAEGPGDILVFLPGEREIRETQEALRKHHPPGTEILPLYARQSVTEQARVFQPHSGRRIVLATNVAETSLTVPGIRYVIDTGLARVKRYSLRNKIEQLKIERISQAAAQQRAGRCGRVAAGIAIRLYDEQDFAARPAYTTPELLRSSLAGVILRMRALGLPDVEAFPFPDPPEPKRVRDGYALLTELGALDEARNLTPIGRELARLPVDPRIGRMLIAAREKCLAEVLVIAAFLSVQDPRVAGSGDASRGRAPQDKAADEAGGLAQEQGPSADAHSDFIAILRLWARINALDAKRKSARQFTAALQAEFLSPQRVREWRDVHGQLANLVKEMGWKVNAWPEAWVMQGEAKSAAACTPAHAAYANLHQALLAGLLGNVGMLTEAGDYLGARGIRFAVFPGSGVRKRPKWIMAAEIVETRRVYARTVARVEPEWVEAVGSHLLKRSYSDPHWAKKPAHVTAYLRATLHGLPVVNARPVHYGPIDPVLSRELFIRHALVRGEWDCRAPFFRHNRQLLAELDDLAQRTRNPRLAADEEALYAHFDALVPAGVHNGAAFERWRREAEAANPRLLFLDRESLLADRKDGDGFPQVLELDGARYDLSYRFEPGAADDGVTLLLPLAALNQVPEAACDWLVPGLLEEKIAALLKTLPQSWRRNFVPLSEYARAAAAALSTALPAAGRAPLTDSLARFLAQTTGVSVPRDAWRPDALPAHLVMNYRVLDAEGRVLAEGRDLSALRRRLGGLAEQAMQQSAAAWERVAVSDWDFGDLPDRIEVNAAGRSVHAFPALEVTADGGVRLRLFDNPAAARAAHRLGVNRLLWLAHPDLLRQTERDLKLRLKTTCLQWGLMHPGSGCRALTRDILHAACRAAMPGDAADIRTREAFMTTAQGLRPVLPAQAAKMADLAADCIARAHRLRESLARTPTAWGSAVADMRAQLDDLIPSGFLVLTPTRYLMRLPAYLKAMELRLEKLAKAPGRDAQAMAEMAPVLAAWRSARRDALDEAALADFRWRLEELRIALFAQEVRTAEPVSTKRLLKRWEEIRS